MSSVFTNYNIHNSEKNNICHTHQRTNSHNNYYTFASHFHLQRQGHKHSKSRSDIPQLMNNSHIIASHEESDGEIAENKVRNNNEIDIHEVSSSAPPNMNQQHPQITAGAFLSIFSNTQENPTLSTATSNNNTSDIASISATTRDNNIGKKTKENETTYEFRNDGSTARRKDIAIDEVPALTVTSITTNNTNIDDSEISTSTNTHIAHSNSNFKNDQANQTESKEKKKVQMERKKRAVSIAGISPYVAYINDTEKSKQTNHLSNYVRTTKYTWWSFLPQFLLDQGKRYYNIFFIVTLLFSFIPNISPVSPMNSALPVLFILGSAAFREIFEDIKRLLADWKANAKKCRVVRDGEITMIPSSQVKVGDFVLVKNGEVFVADILALSSSERNRSCKIETSSLDGETNLKLKRSANIKEIYLDSPKKTQKLSGYIECQSPTPKLTEFIGSLKLSIIENDNDETRHLNDIEVRSVDSEFSATGTNNSGGERVIKETVALDIDNLLLRGASLVGTEWVYGVVVFTGSNTKLLKNYRKGKSKLSYLERTMNSFLLFLIAAHQILSILSVVFAVLCQNFVTLRSFYIYPLEPSPAGFLFILGYYLTFFILYNLFVPMSLFVSVEFIKGLQLFIMSLDKSMIESAESRFKGNTSNLNADLSQIEVIFADKTGTLTQNEMVFKQCAVKGGKTFDERENPGIIRQTLFGAGTPDQQQQQNQEQNILLNMSSSVDLLVSQNNDQYRLKELVYCLAICHSINPEKCPKTGKMIYAGESPDEVEFLNMARSAGIELIERGENEITLSVNDNDGSRLETFEVLKFIAFTSERARCTIVVRKSGEEKCICYCKGSDTAIMSRLRDEADKKDTTLVHTVSDFALNGLRTLAIAKKEVDYASYYAWDQKLKIVLNDVSLTPKKRLEQLDEIHNLMEKDFELLGVTAIEDRLQDKVPETIQYFRDAGIQMWMLTGDKHETAENIAASARMIDRTNTHCYTIVKMESFDQCSSELMSIKKKILENKKAETDKRMMHAIITDGQTLNFIFGETGDSLSKKSSFDSFIKELKRKREAQMRNLKKIRKRSVSALQQIAPQPVLSSSLMLTQDIPNSSDQGLLTVVSDSEVKSTTSSSLTVQTNAPTMKKKNSLKKMLSPTKSPKMDILKMMSQKQTTCFQEFVDVCQHCSTVVCCRASPSQKALMVRMVSKEYSKIGLAIGDGLNDVSMIQEARVGIGIIGKEGSQASRAADYAIPSFRHLKRLLAVHGRYSLLRTGKFVQYSFYKNVVITLANILFCVFCLFSGMAISDTYLLAVYNSLFTLMPPFFLGLFDKDADEEVIENNPEVYREFTKLHTLDWYSFVIWMAMATYHAAACFFIVFFIQRENDVMFSYDGMKTEDLATIGGQFALIITIIVNLKAIICMGRVNFISFVMLIISLLSVAAFNLIYSIFYGSYYFISYLIFTNTKFYLTTLLCVAVCLIPDIAGKFLQKTFIPYRWEKLQLQKKKRELYQGSS